MRLDRLDLTRYGRFTDHVLDFGTAAQGQPDLHIVYGPNEAGKSTLLSAWLDLLFGVPQRSGYNFLHDYSAMQIGASLSLATGQQQVIRTKGTRNTLTDATGQPLPESVLQAVLGGLDRSACADMFALDAETMEKGGESILSSKGNLGELLFSATAGLSDLSRRLGELREEGDDFWKKRGRGGRLKALREEIARINSELRDVDVQAPEYARRRAAAATARAERDRLLAASSEAIGDRDRAKAALEALPILAKWRAVNAEAEPLAALPEAPADWPQQVAKLRRDEAVLADRRRAITEQIQRLQARLDNNPPDDAALAFADALAANEALKPRYVSGRDDLPRRHDELAALLQRLAALADSTGGKPDDPALDAATLDALERLATDHAALAERQRFAADEARQAEAALTSAGGPLTEDDTDQTPAVLRAALEPLRSADLSARLSDATETATEAAARRDAALARLAPWRGDAAALRDLPVPPAERLTASRDQLGAAQTARDNARRLLAERQDDALTRAAQRDALAESLGEAAPETAARTRAQRDAAWTAHRAELSDASADRFAAAMAAHDRATETQLASADHLGRLRLLTVDAATADRVARDAAAKAETAENSLANLRADLATKVAFLPDRDPADPLAGVADWLAARLQTLDLADTADAAARTAQRAQSDVTRAQAALVAALGTEGDLPALAAKAQAELDRHEADAALRAERRRLTNAHAQRAQALKAAEQALKAWSAALLDTLSATPLDPPTPARLRALLPDLRAYASAQRELADLRHRIAKMEADAQRFTDAVGALGAALDLAAGEPLSRHAAAVARLDRAERIAELRVEAADELANAQDALDEVSTAQMLHAGISSDITAHLSVADLPQAEAVLSEIAHRTQLRREADALAQRLTDLLAVASPQDAATALADRSADELRDALTRAEAAREDAEALLETARRALFEADQALASVPGDERVARLGAERQTLLLTLEDEARAWVRQRAGILATHQALDAYRTTHRGQMMARASDAFAAITGGAYTGLTAQPAADGSETLIAMTAEGGSKTPEVLSKGTRFQLYLALRIAGFHEWVSAHGAVPVIADDIMETFDDTRTRLALGALSEMSRSGQVIYLTHHRHVCELAREACPGVRIVEL